ncbi:DsbA family protein [Spongiibacter marinus]|uniref:DsbA family protein n=1 Tax=Spongiibacter marinus TaxID=354246 RepID=UPI00195FDA4A|nr:DsbA family protein [Spongiibacter marinus]MBM7422467.1 2-hydroxychromene-2-carboxylate isomerase [Spongiibacter marinus]
MNPLMPHLARVLSSTSLLSLRRGYHSAKRRLAGRPHTLDVFIRVDDPYSYLLLQVMDDVCSRFNVEVKWWVIVESPEDMYPEKTMWREYACRDAEHLARLYNLDFPSQLPALEQAAIDHTAVSLLSLPVDDFPRQARGLLAALWQGRMPTQLLALDSWARQCLAENSQRLQTLGHYAGAMIYCAPEWYWGVDRLDHLERRLITEGGAKRPDEKAVYTRSYSGFCRGERADVVDPDLPLVLYWSARSPYSYLALEKAAQLSEHYGIALEVKPVLPMMMRGMPVPPDKKMYIFHDTVREAEKQGLEYGFVADPLGDAVERCYALCDYAESSGRLLPFLLSFARGVNAQGIDAASDRGLKRIIQRCGLDWETARQQLGNDHWRGAVQKNLEEMYAMGCWGVPSFRYGELVLWGQDRIGIVENAMIGSAALHRC